MKHNTLQCNFLNKMIYVFQHWENSKVQELIKKETFDAVVIQQQSQRASWPEGGTCQDDGYLNALIQSKIYY